MANPMTARAGRSIWDIVSCETFEAEVHALAGRGVVREPHVLLEKDWPITSNEHVLPFGVVLQLSDDFAFISACEHGVGSVSAAAIEPRTDGAEETVLRLAANEGVSETVQTNIPKLLETLERCAKKEISREQCRGHLFEIILALNMNRILGRLDSKHFKRPGYYHRSFRAPLTERLKRMVCCPASRPAPDKQRLNELSRNIGTMHDHFIQLETKKSTDMMDILKKVVQAAYDITVDGTSFPARLRATGLPAKDCREIREVGKIAAYWRISCTLTHLTRSHREMFAKLRLEIVRPYQPRPGPRYVHAEIQMIVYYEAVSSRKAWPLVIGASKEACYLCYSFIKAHGRFFVSKGHGQLYPQWTVPDLEEYTPSTLQRFRHTVDTVFQAMKIERESIQGQQRSRPYPLQSSINLHKLNLPTPSSTSLNSSHETKDVVVSALSSVMRTNKTLLLDDHILLPASALAGPSGTRQSPPLVEMPAPQTNDDQPNGSETGALVIKPDSSAFIDLGWVDLEIHLEPHPFQSRQTPSFQRASIRFHALNHGIDKNRYISLHRICIEDLAPGNEITFEVSSVTSDGRRNGAFVISDGNGEAVQVSCSWHI